MNDTPSNTPTARLRFNRHELAGAFGDLGTDLPLIVGMVVATGLDPASVLVMFHAMQILTGVVYRMPMPVQPLKVVAVLVIPQKLAPNVIYGAGRAQMRGARHPVRAGCAIGVARAKGLCARRWWLVAPGGIRSARSMTLGLDASARPVRCIPRD